MYTLKLDWKDKRIRFVLSALLEYSKDNEGSVASLTRKLDLRSYLDPQYFRDMEEVGATLKLNLSDDEVDLFQRVLDRAIQFELVRYGELVAAYADIESFRKSLKEAQDEVRADRQV